MSDQKVASGSSTRRRNAEEDAAHYLTLAQESERELRGPNAKLWLDQLKREHDDLRATLNWFVEHGRIEQGLEMGAALYRFWLDGGYSEEGRKRLAMLLTTPGSERPTVARAKAARAAGHLAFQEGDDDSARSMFDKGLTLSRELGYKEGMADACVGLGRVALRRSDYLEVRRLYEESLAIFRELGDDSGVGLSLNQLAEGARLEGDYERARAPYNESLEIYRRLENRAGVSVALNNLAYVEKHAGNLSLAKSLFVECLNIAWELDNKYLIPYGLMGLGGVAAAEGKAERAAKLLGATEAQLEASGYVIDPGDRPEYEHGLALARSGMDGKAFSAAWTEGRSMPAKRAIEYALEKTKGDHVP